MPTPAGRAEPLAKQVRQPDEGDLQSLRPDQMQRLMQTVGDLFRCWSGNAHHQHRCWRHVRGWRGAIERNRLDRQGRDLQGRL